ncbi:MAG: hypothetical protein EBV07_00850, partial [Proteobacteria bacterium]|nr:hypothetical protein [Pseudomonadota bacterium]
MWARLLRTAFAVSMTFSLLLIAFGVFQLTTEANKTQQLHGTSGIEQMQSLKDVNCKTSCIVVLTSGLDDKFRINGIEQQGNGIRLVRSGDVKITFEISGTHRNQDMVDPIQVDQMFKNPAQLTWDGHPIVRLVYVDG